MPFDYEKAIRTLSGMTNSACVAHSLGTMEMCATLAGKYGADIESAKIAGLLHDCARELTNEEKLSACGKYGIVLDEFYTFTPMLTHGLLGAKLAESAFELDGRPDKPDILLAIADHGTGRPEMPLLSQILLIADFSEPTRGDWAEPIRKAADESLNKGLIAAFNHYMGSMVRQSAPIHPLMWAGRNYAILEETK